MRGIDLPTDTDRIILSDRKKMVIIMFDELVRIEGLGSYCVVYSTSHPPFTLSKNLGSIVPLLPARGFPRVHQSHLINIKMVHQVSNEDGCTIYLQDGSKVPVSRRRKDGFLQMLYGK